MRYLRGKKDYMLTYKRTYDLEVVGYSDSNHAGYLNSRRSTSSYIFMLAGGAISWRSATDFGCTSTMEAESISCSEASS